MLLKEGHILLGGPIGHGTSQWTPFWLLEWKIQKDGAKRCAYKKDNATMIAWILTMQECGLSIALQQLKTKVAE